MNDWRRVARKKDLVVCLSGRGEMSLTRPLKDENQTKHTFNNLIKLHVMLLMTLPDLFLINSLIITCKKQRMLFP